MKSKKSVLFFLALSTIASSPAARAAYQSAELSHSPVIVANADRADATYTIGDSATFFVHILSSVYGTDGDQEFVANGYVNSSRVGGNQASATEFAFAAGPFATAQLGGESFKVDVYVRSKSRADSIRNAIANAQNEIGKLIEERDSVTDQGMKSYYQSKIDGLDVNLNELFGELDGLLSFEDSATVPFRVIQDQAPIANNFSVAATGSPLRIDVFPHTVNLDHGNLKVTGVTQGSRGTVSVNSDGTLLYNPDPTRLFRVEPVGGSINNPPNGSTYGSWISGNGGYIVTNSYATNLVTPNIIPAVQSLSLGYGFDVSKGLLSLVTRGLDGSVPNGPTYGENASWDGRYIDLETTNGVTNFYSNSTQCNVFVLDRYTAQLTAASVGPNGLGDQCSYHSWISGDGTHVVFVSTADNLIANVTPPSPSTPQAYVRDLMGNTTYLLSGQNGTSNGFAGAGVTADLSISGNGLIGAFVSTSTNLVQSPAVSGQFKQIYISNIVAGTQTTQTTTLVSVADPSTSTPGQPASADAHETLMSSDGTQVAFVSQANNLVVGATGNSAQAYLRNLSLGTTTRVVSSFKGGELGADVSLGTNSADMRFLTFQTAATNVLSTTAAVTASHCYLTDLTLNKTIMLDVAADGTIGNGPCNTSSISNDGLFATVDSAATNMSSSITSAVGMTYVVTKVDTFTYTVNDGHGGVATGTVTVTEPLTGVQNSQMRVLR